MPAKRDPAASYTTHSTGIGGERRHGASRRHGARHQNRQLRH